MPSEPAERRKVTCKDRYGQIASGKWVRKSAFREIDYDPDNPDKLREFDSFDKAFEFDEARRMDGTGGRHAKPYPKPKDTVLAYFGQLLGSQLRGLRKTDHASDFPSRFGAREFLS